MIASHFFLFLALLVLHNVNAAKLPALIACDNESDSGNSVQISVRSKRNETGDWVTTFAAYGNGEKSIDGLNLDVKQSVFSKKSLLIQGIFSLILPTSNIEAKEELEAVTSEISDGDLIFHERTGKGIRLSNNGRTAERINPSGDFNDAVVLTNRTLKDNELFEVRLDKTIDEWMGSIEFGVTSKSPTEIPLLSFHGDYSEGYTWFYESQNFFGKDGVPTFSSYKEGYRFGVKRIPSGELQYFINGELIGTADTKVPEEVYGIIDLYANGVQATIVNPKISK